jgi:hypothetical protein
MQGFEGSPPQQQHEPEQQVCVVGATPV